MKLNFIARAEYKTRRHKRSGGKKED